MKKTKSVIIITGIALILLAPLFGNGTAFCYLGLFGGMETENYLLIIKGCIHSFQIIGTLITAYGLFGCK